MAVMDDRANASRNELHLLVAITGAIVYIPDHGTTILSDGGLHNRHKIYEVIIEENIDAGDETAGIIDHGNDIYLVLFTIIGLKVRTYAGIGTPYFIDVRTFITSHVAGDRILLLELKLLDKTVHCRF